jgi:hypothetical protein
MRPGMMQCKVPPVAERTALVAIGFDAENFSEHEFRLTFDSGSAFGNAAAVGVALVAVAVVIVVFFVYRRVPPREKDGIARFNDHDRLLSKIPRSLTLL